MSAPMAKRHGIRNSTYIVDVIMPPNVGVAIGLVMSIPEPVANMIGRSPSTVVATVISFTIDDGRIVAIDAVRNPDKLRLP